MTKRLILRAIITTAAILAVPSARADTLSEACKMRRPQTVSVDLDRLPIRESGEISLTTLRNAAATNHYSGPVVGAYGVTIAYRMDTDSTTEDVRAGQYCLEPNHIILRAQVDRVIYIPPELAGDDCLSKLSREHGQKRIEAESPAIEQLQAKFVAAIDVLIAKPRAASRTTEEALSAFVKEAQAAAEHVLDQIKTDRKKLADALNTEEEFDRERGACPGRYLVILK